jgi:hypothetical protein
VLNYRIGKDREGTGHSIIEVLTQYLLGDKKKVKKSKAIPVTGCGGL